MTPTAAGSDRGVDRLRLQPRRAWSADGEVAADGHRLDDARRAHARPHLEPPVLRASTTSSALFTGDHIMGWSTTVIGPPDGDMRAYFESLRKVQGRDDRVFWPTHGAPVTDTRPFLEAFLAHRLDREAQVLAAVRGGHTSIKQMVEVLYADVRKELHKPAARSVLAHLVKLSTTAWWPSTTASPACAPSTGPPDVDPAGASVAAGACGQGGPTVVVVVAEPGVVVVGTHRRGGGRRRCGGRRHAPSWWWSSSMWWSSARPWSSSSTWSTSWWRRGGGDQRGREEPDAVARRHRVRVADHVLRVLRDADDQRAVGQPRHQVRVIGVHQRVAAARHHRAQIDRGPRAPRIGRDIDRQLPAPVAVHLGDRHPLAVQEPRLHRVLGPVALDDRHGLGVVERPAVGRPVLGHRAEAAQRHAGQPHRRRRVRADGEAALAHQVLFERVAEQVRVLALAGDRVAVDRRDAAVRGQPERQRAPTSSRRTPPATSARDASPGRRRVPAGSRRSASAPRTRTTGCPAVRRPSARTTASRRPRRCPVRTTAATRPCRGATG